MWVFLVLANCPLMLANYKSIHIISRAAAVERGLAFQLCCSQVERKITEERIDTVKIQTDFCRISGDRVLLNDRACAGEPTGPPRKGSHVRPMPSGFAPAPFLTPPRLRVA